MFKKILIVKTSSLGDIIHAFPTLAYLKAKMPDAEIDWVVEKPFKDLVETHPLIRRALTIDTKKWRRSWIQHRKEIAIFRHELRSECYDLLFDFQGNTKSGLVTSQASCGCKVGFSHQSAAEWPNCLFTHQRFSVKGHGNIREDYLSVVKQFFEDRDLSAMPDRGIILSIPQEERDKIQKIRDLSRSTKHVMICPGSQWRNKQVTFEALKDFLHLLQPYLDGHFYFIWGSKEEKQLVEQLFSEMNAHSSIIDRMPLPTLQNLMHHMDLVIAMDSLPLHLAGAAGVPTFSVFGASSAEKYKPQGSQHQALQGKCPYDRTFDKRCPILRTCPTGSCIRGLTGMEIFEYFQSVTIMSSP